MRFLRVRIQFRTYIFSKPRTQSVQYGIEICVQINMYSYVHVSYAIINYDYHQQTIKNKLIKCYPMVKIWYGNVRYFCDFLLYGTEPRISLLLCFFFFLYT